MKTTILKSAFLAVLTAGLFTSCVKDDNYGAPQLNGCTETTLVKNREVSDINFPGTLALHQDIDPGTSDVIEAYVTSSDIGGNFFKSISFQTLDGSSAFSIPVDASSTFINYEPGRKVLINLDDLYTQTATSGTIGKVIGDLFLSSSGTAAIGRLPEYKFNQSVQRSCTVVSEDELVQHLTIAQAVNDANLNKLIEIDNVQFDDAAITSTYYNAGNSIGGATNLNLIDNFGGSIIFRTSAYANFAGKDVASGNGKVRGVLTKYNSGYQFMVRSINDIQLTGTRLNIDFFPPLVGSNILYNTTINETFESYPTSTSGYLFPNYVNDAFVGSRYWDVKTFSSNKYIQMTSFGSGQANKTYLDVPVQFTPGYKFSFKTKDGYNNGNVLKIYYSTDYIPGMIVSDATLIDITSSFAISTGTSTGYAANFTNSGNFVIPAALTGTGFLLFEYSGTTSVTTTIQIDDVKVNP